MSNLTFRWFLLRDRPTGQTELHAITDGVPPLIVTVEPDPATWVDDRDATRRLDERQARLCQLLERRRRRDDR